MRRKSILSLTLAATMLLAQSTMMIANAQVDDPNVELTTAYPLVESDNLLPEAKEIKEISFTDMDAHWAIPAVKVLSANGYVQGMGNGKFAPENNVTRAEFMTMAINALGLEKDEYEGKIPDVAADKWYADIIQTAMNNGVWADDLFDAEDGEFHPDSDITREDAALIIAKVALKNGAVSTDALKLFTDDAEISGYAKNGVSQANSMGLIAGYPDGSFKPKATLTRAEASELLVRAIEKAERLAIYVDPENGNDENDGSKNAPLASIVKATELVKDNNDDMKNHLFVFLKGGEHYLPEQIKMNEEHSGSNGYNIVYTSYGDGIAQLMRAKHYEGFKIADADKNIYKLYVGDVQTRQVFIDGIRATRARSVGGFTNGEINEEFGFYSDDTFLADFKNIKDLETVSYSKWTQPRCGVSEITITEDGRAKIVMDEGWAKNISTADRNTPWTLPSWYENAYELLDLPGEWYINSTDGYLYYIPRPFENPETMVATIPDGERMLTMEGTIEDPIHNITFDGIEFAYNTWMRPSSEQGFNDGQNCYIDSNLAETAVMVQRARYVDFTNNTFQKLGSAALQMMYSIQECDVIGNEFSDLSANGFSLGKGPGDAYETEIKPTEYKYYTINNRINNNYFHDIGVDYGSATAISTTWPKNTQFNHNEIANVNYSGMHMGYGWGVYGENQEKKGTGLVDVELCYNYIHDVMNSYLYDGGCIYTLGATGGTYERPNLWTNNYFESARNAHGCIYPDEGSTYWLIENNVVDYNDVDRWPLNGDGEENVDTKWLHIHTDSIRYNTVRNNYATPSLKKVSSAYNNVDDAIICEGGKWPEEAQNIIDESGLEAEYLAKFPVDVQRFNLKQDSFVAQIGETRQIEIMVYGRKQATAASDKYKAYYVSTNPEIVTVDENGKISVLGEGEAKIYVNVLVDGIIRTKTVNIICGDKLKRVRIDSDFITVVKGFDYTIKPQGITELGRRLDVDSVEYVSNDESIVTVTADNRLHGAGKGETTIDAKFTIDGITVEEKIPVTVISYGNEETAKLPSTKLSDDFFDPTNWKNAKLSADGKGVAVTGSASFYTKEKFTDGLYSFDMQIDNPNSWPSLALCAPDKDLDYSKSDCYFIGFKADHIEVQKFKNGERTMFFGESTFNPTGGSGIPNDGQILEYGKTYHVTVGTIEEEEGVRLILTINGSNIIDYLDADENCLRADGHLGVYVGGGTFTFNPYTGD